jgi:hypothetical protein
MTRSRGVPKTGRGVRAAVRQEPIEHSLYFGRERLGRYLKIDRKTFKAFDFKNRRLGSFHTRARALAAIRKAWARLA